MIILRGKQSDRLRLVINFDDKFFEKLKAEYAVNLRLVAVGHVIGHYDFNASNPCRVELTFDSRDQNALTKTSIETPSYHRADSDLTTSLPNLPGEKRVSRTRIQAFSAGGDCAHLATRQNELLTEKGRNAKPELTGEISCLEVDLHPNVKDEDYDGFLHFP